MKMLLGSQEKTYRWASYADNRLPWSLVSHISAYSRKFLRFLLASKNFGTYELLTLRNLNSDSIQSRGVETLILDVVDEITGDIGLE